MHKIKMVDLNAQYLRIKTEIDAAIQQVLDSTAFINGPQVDAFAQQLSTYLGGAFVVPCANGTDALQIAMMALGLKPGDEVIVPVHTYVATAEVIALLGLRPVFVDVKPDTFTIDVAHVARVISPKTRAIVPVHLYGQCADMVALSSLARAHGICVIEDTAQALGAELFGSKELSGKAGTLGDVGTTSFFPSKNLGCFGDGGAMITNNEEVAHKLKMIANHGQKRKYYHEGIGVNSRLDTLQAAILMVKLKYLNDYTARRNKVAAFYDQSLAGLEGVMIPKRETFSTHVFHQYTLRVSKRDDLKQFLEARSIPTMIYYPVPLHFQPAYRIEGVEAGSFPVAEMLAEQVISLPIHTEMQQEELDFIVRSIKEFYA